MAHRLLPFRQYDENDVVNLFALNAKTLGVDLKLMKPSADDINADGVLVSVENGNMVDNDVNSFGEDDRFMNSYDSPVGRNPYPTNPLKIAPAASGTRPLGVTLNQTLAVDENGESLLFNPVKKDELQAVLSGQTVPVLGKGIITVHQSAVEYQAQGNYGLPIVGDRLISAGGGKFASVAPNAAAGVKANQAIGQVLAIGSRGGPSANRPVGLRPDFQSGNYYVIKLDC
ncbi:MAG: hypothetical protein P8P37_02335 [Candidatus Marinimicrobia bacterium]|nr:hypothetical protein [Candidatus Neomarinimicrobiota bacterium]